MTQSDTQMLELRGEPPILDLTRFDGTACFLEPDAIANYLQIIAGRSDALQNMLREPDKLQNAAIAIAKEAHTVSGAAGMFGFVRLATAASAFEHAVQTSASEALALASRLDAAIAASRPALQCRIGSINNEFTKASSSLS